MGCELHVLDGVGRTLLDMVMHLGDAIHRVILPPEGEVAVAQLVQLQARLMSVVVVLFVLMSIKIQQHHY